jgi:hypothetical protein
MTSYEEVHYKHIVLPIATINKLVPHMKTFVKARFKRWVHLHTRSLSKGKSMSFGFDAVLDKPQDEQDYIKKVKEVAAEWKKLTGDTSCVWFHKDQHGIMRGGLAVYLAYKEMK